jgi:hypothetical protein
MGKKIYINAGTALLINDLSDALTGYDSIVINGGSIIASREAYDKLIGMGASINSGKMEILDISGDVVELSDKTCITAEMSYDGCYVICDGKLVIEDASGLGNITGLYAQTIFHPESVNLSAITGIKYSRRVVFTDGARLHLGDKTLGDDSHIVLTSGLYWVSGSITALDDVVLDKLRSNSTTFKCGDLFIYTGLYEKYRDMFQADNYIFIPNDHTVLDDVTLDAATSVLHGDKLYILNDLMIPHNQTQHLGGFSSIIVDGAVTMPVSAAAAFKACGKANDYELYEGILMSINGVETINHDQLQSALAKGITYTLDINGVVKFLDDVTADDIDAIAAISCNGVIYAPGNARGVLDSKIKSMNGKIMDVALYDENKEQSDSDVVKINAGTYRL